LDCETKTTITIGDRRIGKLYNELCDVIDSLNKIFTNPCVVIFPNILIKSIFAAFAVVYEFKLQSENTSIVYVICGFAFVNYFGLVMVTVSEGSRLTTKATDTSTIITQMISGDQLNQTQKKKFSNKLIFRNVFDFVNDKLFMMKVTFVYPVILVFNLLQV
jgi:7tm Chemosensory receptor